MHFDFPINHVKFEFQCFGTGEIKLFCNGEYYQTNEITEFDDRNEIIIQFLKKDPADKNSFAKLKNILINGFSFIEKFKSIKHEIDKNYHQTSQTHISNNLYFGYIGKTKFTITHKNDPLTNAAWIIANNEFEHVKYPFKGEIYREKTFQNIVRDTKFMFTGSLSPQDKDIKSLVDSQQVGNLLSPLHDTNIVDLQDWINKSNRITLHNFQDLSFFSFLNGNNEGIASFLSRAKKLYVASKKYFFVGELLDAQDKIVKDPYVDEIENDSDILLEFPSPWYPVSETQEIISKAKDKSCRIALDLIWLPLITHNVDIDLSQVDEIYFSMNKTWPIYEIRPAFRWSKNRINDLQTLQYEHCTYNKLAPNIFFEIMKRFSVDYVHDRHKNTVEHLCKMFSLDKTNVLIFALGQDDRHDYEGHTSKHLNLDEFVCLRKLIDYQGKYFW